MRKRKAVPARTQGAGFAAKVARWQKRHGRHELPWQITRDAYRIWLSEIMLQQTQVATVIPYFERFVARFPDVQSLARAHEDEVLTLWSGLGYYSRARNLHRAAQAMVEQHNGEVPRGVPALLELPGVGRSTAAAIAVFAFGERAAILDGNVKRLFARRFAIGGWPGEPKVLDALWREAQRQLPAKDIEAYTQGLMDLGATVCMRANPRCDACPLADECLARATGSISRMPAPRPRKTLPQRQTQMLVLLHANEVLLEKRAPTGIWGGLWSLPEAPVDADVATVCRERYGAHIAGHTALTPVAHGFTHFKLDIVPQRVAVDRLLPRAQAPGVTWLTLEDALGAALPSPVRRILQSLAKA